MVAEQLPIQPGTSHLRCPVTFANPDWHVYWKYPGDSGLPTTLEWTLPPGFSAGPLQWPVPERFVTEGLVTYGYAGQVLLITEITPQRAASRHHREAQARASWLACRVECTPGKASLELSLPVRTARPQRTSGGRRCSGTRGPSCPDGRALSIHGCRGLPHVTLRGTAAGSAGRGRPVLPGRSGQVNVSSPQQVKRARCCIPLRMQREADAGACRGSLGYSSATGAAGSRAFDVSIPVAACAGRRRMGSSPPCCLHSSAG